MALSPLLLGSLVLLCCAIVALQLWIISGRFIPAQDVGPVTETTSKILPQTSQKGSSQAQTSPRTGAASNRGPKCFRLTNIPLEWSQDDLLKPLQELEPSLSHFDGRISLYPACCGPTTQTVLLNLQTCYAFFQHIGPDDKTRLSIPGKVANEAVVLSVDCNFYGLTPLNNPGDDSVAEFVYPFAIGSQLAIC
ncbi:hypothetical protein FN846DRAFT_889579 [Sphaerosporella brunnea]|uniref:Uncharacterized protein n=1 Tax=Sphaerosporella brunnea TaxID=1250544 RepID=A0A5J5EYT3_9PEZI|nr:hypothetical protein FN846DRAFT_889579 [Sphaerosporella brunnea]